MTATPYTAVLVTVPNKKLAQKLALGLVEAKLAACVNIVPAVESVYWWEGKIERAQELLLVAKTRSSLVPEVATYVRQHHTYAVPEVVALPVAGGSAQYLDWVGANTLFHPPKEEERPQPQPR